MKSADSNSSFDKSLEFSDSFSIKSIGDNNFVEFDHEKGGINEEI